ncbi:MAG: HAD hydrolase family protein, partial [Cardiobacteriaceae bacterium]|nr:HAD hydrolase family protein [Cardiobacteriaceae bacterium]
IYQMNTFITPEEEKILFESGLLERGYQIIRWHPHAVDLLHSTGSKARGIRAVCDILGIDLADTMAFGDELNDLEMFKTVGFGVAMGDGRDELKALAKYVTGTLEEHGIYNALVHLGVIEGPSWEQK